MNQTCPIKPTLMVGFLFWSWRGIHWGPK